MSNRTTADMTIHLYDSGSALVLDGIQGLTDADLGQLRDLDDTHVGDRSIEKLSRLPRLRTLRLRHTRVTDHGAFELLRVHSLRSVCLTETAVSHLAKRRLDNNILLEVLGFSTALRVVRHYADRLARILILHTRVERGTPMKL